MCAQISIPASAANQNSVDKLEEIIYISEICESTDGFMYLLGTSQKCATILVNEYTGEMIASISFQEGEVYEFSFDTIPLTNFDISSQESWYNS